jgi:hypothetical protein
MITKAKEESLKKSQQKSEKEVLEKRLESIQKIEDLKNSLKNSGQLQKSDLSDYLEQKDLDMKKLKVQLQHQLRLVVGKT